MREGAILYRRKYAESVPWGTLNPILFSLSRYHGTIGQDRVQKTEIGNYRLSYLHHSKNKTFFSFLTDLGDEEPLVNETLDLAKREFFDLYPESLILEYPNLEIFDSFSVVVDRLHKDLRPKVALVGFSGVGKTTLTKLIRAQEIPMEHIPTISGDIATIKIGKLYFSLFDFAGQEKYAYLWPKFIQGADAILLVMDSTFQNIGKSKYFIHLVQAEEPFAQIMGIANKQDLPNALTPEEISKILEIPVRGMVAINPNNRGAMINIIAETLQISKEASPLLKSLVDRDNDLQAAEEALTKGDLETAEAKFESIARSCMDLGDEDLANWCLRRARRIRESTKKPTTQDT